MAIRVVEPRRRPTVRIVAEQRPFAAGAIATAVTHQPGDLLAPAREPPESPLPVIAVVVSKRPHLAPHVARNLARQDVKPTSVVVCSAVPGYDVAPISTLGVPVVFVRGAGVLGELRNQAVEAAVAAAVVLPGGDAILANVDDDDLYGSDYFAGIVDAFQRHPDALVVGLGMYGMRQCTFPPEEDPGQSVRRAPFAVGAVPGATISVRASTWRYREELRYPALGMGEDTELLRRAQGSVVSAGFGMFQICKYNDTGHGHASVGRIGHGHGVRARIR